MYREKEMQRGGNNRILLYEEEEFIFIFACLKGKVLIDSALQSDGGAAVRDPPPSLSLPSFGTPCKCRVPNTVCVLTILPQSA